MKTNFKKSISAMLAALLLLSLLPVVPVYAATITFSGGNGTSGNPYQITTAAQLASLATEVNANNATYNAAYYKMMNDISLSSYNWIPIGNYTYPFKGNFNGSGYIISALSMSGAKTVNYLGLFGYAAEGSVIRNLGMTNVNINTTHSSAPYIGGLVGYNNGTIINCYTTGSTVKGSYTGGSIRVGGLVGYNSSGSITNCYSVITNITGNADGNGANLVGGLTGANLTNSTITNCYAASSTLTSGGGGGNRTPGGIAGESSGTVTNCFWNSSATHYSNGAAQTRYGLGGLSPKNTGTTSMTPANMQAAAFATTLNSGKASISGAATWVYSSGYPSFSAFTITYDANGGSLDNVPPPQKNYAGAANNVTAQTLTRQGYSFLGWSADSGAASAEYRPGAAYTNNADVTLYAVWVADINVSGEITIGYSYDGGNIDESIRQKTAVVSLQRNTSGNFEVIDTQTVTFNTTALSDTQNYSFTNLPALDVSGNPYTYKVTTEVSNYTVSYAGNDITLTYDPNNFDAHFEITPNADVKNPPASIKLKILYSLDKSSESQGIITQHSDTYITAVFDHETGKYSGSYPVWKLDNSDSPKAYGYQIVLLDGQGLANVQYGDWIWWEGTEASGSMTATFGMKKQTAINDTTAIENGFSVLNQSNLDEVFDRVVKPADTEGDSIVTLSLNVSDIGGETSETAAIKAAADNGSEVYFFDISLVKTVDGSASETLTNIPIPLEIHIKLTDDLAGKSHYKVYRYHNGVAEQISNDPAKTEHYVVDVAASEIIIYTMKFSTYAIFGNDYTLDFDEGYDVDVQAKITGDDIAVYKIDIAWGAMTFEYSTNGVWNPDTHSYDENSTVGWLQDGFIFGNNKITAWNHSNGDVLVSFDITETYISGTTMTVKQNNSADDNTAAVDMPLSRVPNEEADAPSIDAFLWLSGEPNNPSTLKGDTYTKIAVITVTIEATGGERTPTKN